MQSANTTDKHQSTKQKLKGWTTKQIVNGLLYFTCITCFTKSQIQFT